jgi:uncharacterized membrane protein (DUF2068 family)
MNNAGSSVLLAGLVSLGYAGMLLAEGIGLWLEFTWAAYLTVVLDEPAASVRTLRGH